MKHIWAIFGVVVFFHLLPQYQGDSVIYLCYARNWFNGLPFQFNVGEFSSGATSPLWSAMLSVCFFFSEPWIAFKVFSLIVYLVAIYLADGLWGGIYAYLLTAPALLGYETGLLVIALTLLIRYHGSGWSFVLWMTLPFIRPEAIVISIGAILYEKKYWGFIWLIPILAYWTYSTIETGYFCTSCVFRAQAGDWVYYGQRYAVIVAPFVVHRLEKIHIPTIDAAWIMVVVLAYASIKNIAEYGKPWEVITNKANAEHLVGSGTVQTKEVQERYYIPESFRVMSEDGITDGMIGTPTHKNINGVYVPVEKP